MGDAGERQALINKEVMTNKATCFENWKLPLEKKMQRKTILNIYGEVMKQQMYKRTETVMSPGRG